MGDTPNLANNYLEVLTAEWRKLKGLADRALAQVADADLFTTLDPESNSLAVLLKHLGGNLRSRWTDFLTSDGEKPDRLRDTEFEIPPGTTREDILAIWELGWSRLFGTLEKLTAADLEKTVTIRSEPHSVPQALERSYGHTAYHVGQIVLLAKHTRSTAWQNLSVPRGGSAAFLQKMQEQFEK